MSFCQFFWRGSPTVVGMSHFCMLHCQKVLTHAGIHHWLMSLTYDCLTSMRNVSVCAETHDNLFPHPNVFTHKCLISDEPHTEIVVSWPMTLKVDLNLNNLKVICPLFGSKHKMIVFNLLRFFLCQLYLIVGLPVKFCFNVGPASWSIAGSMPVNRLRRWLNTNPSLSQLCRLLWANPWHSPNTVSMLTHSLRRLPVFETTLGDFAKFFDCCIGRVPFTSQRQITQYIGSMLM